MRALRELKEKWNHQETRWVKEKYRPFREKNGLKTLIVGFFIGVATWLGWLNSHNYIYFRPVYYVTATIAIIIISVGAFMIITGFNLQYMLREIVVGELVCYEYTDNDKKQKRIFESVGDAEQAIENPKAEEEEP